MTTPWKTYVLLISACQFTFEAWLNIRQFHALKKIAVPRIVSENLDKHTVEKSHAYKREKTKLSLASGLWGQVINFLVIYFDGLPWLWDAMGQWLGGSGLFTPTDTSRSIAFAVGYLWFSNCVFLPVQLYDTFVIESTFGFNKQTPGLFLCDFLKIQALNAAILAPSLALFLAIVARTGDSFAFYVWLGMTVIQALIITLDPILFTPLFNTLRPITDDKLLPKVQALATKAGFPLNRLYVSDSSKRSAHSNAYFYGFPWQMQVVVQDTLLQKHSSDEITAVIAHEFGHWKSQHSAKSFLMQQVCFFLSFHDYTQILTLYRQIYYWSFFASPHLLVAPTCTALLAFSPSGL